MNFVCAEQPDAMIICDICHQTLAKNAPVYRPITGRLKLCRASGESMREPIINWETRTSCSECDRVIFQDEYSNMRIILCSDDCNRARAIRRQKQARAEKRIRICICQVCGTEFKTTRVDTKFCPGGKCRI